MTCVIAARTPEGSIVMGADHAFIMNGNQTMLGGYGHKIRIANNFVVGYAGTASVGVAMLDALEEASLVSTDDEFTSLEIADLFNTTWDNISREKQFIYANHFLIGYNQNIYQFWSDFVCQKSVDGYEAIGTNTYLFKALYKINLTKTGKVFDSVSQTILDASIVCDGVKCFDAGPTIVVL